MCYVKTKRADFSAKNPSLKFGDLSKKIATAWKELEPEDKKVYEDMNLKDKKRYELEMESYQKPESGSEESDADSDEDDKKKKKGKTTKKKAKKDPLAPKKNMNAYMHYTIVNREKVKADNKDLKGAAVTKELGASWKKLTPEEKKPYDELAQKDKIRYEKEFEKYNQ